MRIRRGWLPLVFGLAAVYVALAGLLYVLGIILAATTTLLEIGSIAHG